MGQYKHKVKNETLRQYNKETQWLQKIKADTLGQYKNMCYLIRCKVLITYVKLKVRTTQYFIQYN
jgi:hypothetical protein